MRLTHENIASNFPETPFALDTVRKSHGTYVLVKTRGSCLAHVAYVQPGIVPATGWGVGWCPRVAAELDASEFAHVDNA